MTGAAVSGNGNTLANSIIGNGAANRLFGLGGTDTLDGGAGADTLIGGVGADRLIGGAGGDVFDFDAVSESTPTVSDTIAGIDGIGVGGGDRIDLQTIDANITLAGNQAFILGGAFTAGHLRLTNLGSNTILEGNTDGDAAAELRIVIEDGAIVAANYIGADFFL